MMISREESAFLKRNRRAVMAARSDMATSRRGSTRPSSPSSKQARMGTIVSQLRKERLPLAMSVS